MIRVLGCFIFLIGISHISYSQYAESPFEWSVFSEETYALTDCDFDKGAEALVLGAWGACSIISETVGNRITYKSMYQYHYRVKILSTEGLEYANIEIPYWENDKVEKIKGQAINMVDGFPVIHKLKKSDIIDDEIKDIVSYKKFTIPQVKVGSIIEYSYILTSKSVTSLRPWFFQKELPVLESIYEFYPDDNFLHVKMIVSSHPIESKKEEKRKTVYNWRASEVPSMREEEYVSNMDDYYSQIRFQLKEYYYNGFPEQIFSTWKNVAQEIRQLNSYRKAMKGGAFDKEIFEKIVETTSEEEKLKQTFNHLRNKYKWNGRLGVLPNEALSEIKRTKIGNGAALNLILLSTLKKMGIEANPLIISTKSHGKLLSTYPFVDQFNHVIVQTKVDGQDLLVDLGSYNSSYNLLPQKDLNDEGFLLKGKDGELIKIVPRGKKQQTCSISLKLDEANLLSGNLDYLFKGYTALEERKKAINKGTENYFGDILKDLNQVEIVSSKVMNLEDTDVPFKAQAEIKTKDYFSSINDFIYLSPMFFEAWEEQPFKLEKRNYPVDFIVPINEIYVLNLTIPDGYKVEEMPKSVKVALEGNRGSLEYRVNPVGMTIQVISKIKINQTVFAPSEYFELKEFFDLIIEKHAEQIVLKKVQ